jgi:hypothetical protein
MTDPFQTNRLGEETSPYLLQHKDNPVHWQAWRPEVLEYARKNAKPILLSIGYAACHWCHVMEHESFEDPKIAAVMNENFVNIKVDREERPDVDAIYMNALAFLGQQGGWPLTMFLMPDGKPFWGGTYFPPTENYGRPAFSQVLEKISEAYYGDQTAIRQNVASLTERLNALAGATAPGLLQPQAETLAADTVLKNLDRRNGGLSGAPKFPQPSVFELVWRAYIRTGDKTYFNAVTRTLDHIADGGIYDHIGGGFARYTIDAQWLVPHFEKMLYDNAQLVSLYTAVWQDTRSPVHERRIRDTVAWLLRDMVTDSGAFAASYDADSEGEEGKFYVWRAEQIRDLLGDDYSLFAQIYDVDLAGNWENKTILNRLKSRHIKIGPDHEASLARSRRVLFEEREKRVKPGWDDKVLTDWNGLAIAALAEAGAVFHETLWIEMAKRAFNAIVENLAVPGLQARLHHSFRNGDARHVGLLDDYAAMAHAAVTLHDVTGFDDYIAWAAAWMETLDSHYRDKDRGGYFLTADDAETLIIRTRTAIDNTVPAGNSLAAYVMARLYHLTGDTRYRDRAAETIKAFAGDLSRLGTGLATLIKAHEMLTRGVDIVIIGTREEPKTEALLSAVRDCSLPLHTLQIFAPGKDLPEGHPAAGKTDTKTVPAAYVCVDNRCSLPLTTPEELMSILLSARADGSLAPQSAASNS